jgi:hypothetical protein
MAIVVLGGNYVLNKRIREETTFQYEFSDLSSRFEKPAAKVI